MQSKKFELIIFNIETLLIIIRTILKNLNILLHTHTKNVTFL